MRRFVTLAMALVLCAGCVAGATASVPALTDIGAGIQGPPGLHASVYATGLVDVSAFAIDPQGRLWVATAAYSDAGTDGVYLVTAASRPAQSVIGGLHTPLGLLWSGGSLFVSSASGIDVYSGFDGTQFATTARAVTFPAGVGELNGIAASPDGRIVLGISSPCDHCDPASEWSASIVSFLPDGSDLRAEASGIRAAIGLAYDPNGELLATMNQRDDLGDATPGDWLAVVHRGDDWGFPDCYGQGGEACAGVPRPLATLDKHAAVSGLAIVTGTLAGGHAAALVAEWSTGKVQRVVLPEAGSAATVEPFLTGIKQPVALAVASDGALFVGDWSSGTIYRISA
jgi:glucose/arabinose dehydrogenase